MLSVVLLWIALGVPGLALLRRLAPGSLEGGVPSTVALSYLATFALLTPVSLLGFAFSLPIVTLSYAAGLLVLLGAASLGQDLLRKRPRLEAPSGIAIAAGSLVTACVVFGFFDGTHFGGDAGYHVARVRLLLTHGFNDIDPLAKGGTEPVYRLNLYHALVAATASVANVSAGQAWFSMLAWTKLVAAGAAGHLAWACFGQRWIAWTAAAWAAAWNCAYSVLPYPNTLAISWLLPLAAAFTVEACTQSSPERIRRAAIGLCATSLALGQLHGLYAMFMVLMVVPAVSLRVLFLVVRRQRDVLTLCITCALASTPGILWPVGGKVFAASPHVVETQLDPKWLVEPEQASAAPKKNEPDAPKTGKVAVERGFIKLNSGSTIVSPAGWTIARAAPAQLLACLVLAAICSRLRRTLWPVMTMVVMVAVLAHVPFITQLYLKTGQPAWLLRRLFGVIAALHWGVVPGVLLALLPSQARWLRWLRVPGLILVVLVAAICGERKKPWSFETAQQTLETVWSGDWHPKGRGRSVFFDKAVPRDETIAVRLSSAYYLITDCDCFPLATREDHGRRGRPDMDERRAATALLLGETAPLETRLALHRHFDVRYLLIATRQLPIFRAIYGKHLKTVHEGSRESVLEIDLGRKTSHDP